MFGSYEGAMVDAAAEPENPDLVPGTRLCFDCKYEEMADHPWCGARGCRCPHCLLRPVSAFDVETMAHRMANAAQDLLTFDYRRARRAYDRRAKALRRLAEALERQAGGDRR